MKKIHNTILVIRSSAMGDVAMTVPVLSELRKKYPETRVVMLTPKLYEPFFDGIGLEFFNIQLKGEHKGISGIWRLFRQLKVKYKFDAVVDLHDKLYSKLLRTFFALSGTKVYSIDKGRSGKRALTRRKNKKKIQLRTTIARYFDTFARAGFPVTVSNITGRTIRPAPGFAGAKNGKWIGVAPFAKHAGKILPPGTIEDLLRIIEKEIPGSTVFIFGGGDGEKAVAENLRDQFSNVTSAVGKVDIRQELDLISNLDVMVSMDSSAMHMSSIVGTPVVSVWGATHPFAGFMGFGQSEDNAVGLEMDCRPCSVYGNKPCFRGNYACLTGITARQIFDKIVAIIKA